MNEKDVIEGPSLEKKERELYSKICFLSNFPPKECGIATFTQDLATAMNKRFNPKLKSRVIALNEPTDMYNYDNRVILQLNKEDIEDYINIAKKINHSKKLKLVCIQHEFGIFGGEYGNYIIPFLETIEKPVITTFHSVLPNPDQLRKKIVRFICEKSAGIVVMAQRAIEILTEDYDVNPKKIHLIHHGIPNVQFQSTEQFKKKLKLQDKIVLSTFGLMSRGKGIEYMIRSLPPLVEKYPNLLYLIIGETHPVIRRNEGEEYRNSLIKEVEKLGLNNHVKFYNKYLSLQEIIEYLLASDIYVCTNLGKEQIVSGTLAYAIGCGKAVVSTPITHAEEILADNRGVLANFKKPASFTKAIDSILSDSVLKEELEKNAYSFGRQMIWSNVAAHYLHVFNEAVNLREETTKKYPKIKMDHIVKLTNNFGMIQFAKQAVPDVTSGYTVDDNSRALIATVLHNNLFKSQVSENLINTYLNFLECAQDENGIFKNNINNENESTNYQGVNYEDALGRALWALGYTLHNSNNQEIAEKAKTLFEKSHKHIENLESPRAKAFSIIGLYYYYKKHQDMESITKINELATELVKLYKESSSEDWHWFEEILSYSNSKLPEALFLVYELTGHKEYLEVAEKTLGFLSNTVFVKGKLFPIGHNGWYKRNNKRALFDQQPVDAGTIVETYLMAYNITKKKEYYNNAVLAFNWFLGNNHLNQMVYDESTGGCHDGLGENSLNFNQGAESTLSYLLARLSLEETKRKTI